MGANRLRTSLMFSYIGLVAIVETVWGWRTASTVIFVVLLACLLVILRDILKPPQT